MQAVRKNHWHGVLGFVLRSGLILLLTLTCSFGQETRQLLLKYRPGLQAAGVQAAARYGKAHHFRYIPWSLVEMRAEVSAEAKTASERSGLYEVVMEPTIYEISRTPNDRLYPQLWGMEKIQAPLAWDFFALNPSIVVAVIDTGIDFSHPDLAPNLWTGPQGEHGYTCTNGIVIPGGLDDHYHGTHVAGTIGAKGNNKLGVVGVNWSIQMISLKFIRASGNGSGADAALLIERMIDLIQAGVPIRVSNNSWGGRGYDPLLEDAFRAAEEAGVLNICAAGNKGLDLSDFPHSPASFALDGIISVLASDQNDNKASFSNYGTDADLAAPGVSILSCKPGGGYQFLSGTSMASPHVAGAAAALFALNPSLSVLEARNILLDSASLDLTPFPFSSTGGGRLNIFKLLNNPLLSQPSSLTNRPPVLVLSPSDDFILPPGQTVTVTAAVSDPNGDETQVITSLSSDQDYTESGLLHEMIGWHYRTNGPVQSLDLYGAPLAIDVAPKLSFFVTDGHGGAASKKLSGFAPREPSTIRDLSTAIQSFTASYDPDTYQLQMRLNVDPAIVAPEECQFAYWFFRNDRDLAQSCCFSPNTDYVLEVPLENPGINTGRAFLMDLYGNSVLSDQVIISLGRTNAVPQIQVAWSALRGPAPLALVADMTGTKADTFLRGLWNNTAFSDEANNPIQTFPVDLPGTWAIALRAYDSVNHTADQIVQLVSVLPLGFIEPAPPPPPTPTLTPPNDLTERVHGWRMTLTWSDTASGETKWEVWRSTKPNAPSEDWTLVATLPANSRSYQQSANRNTPYHFKVRACSTNACGPFSKQTSGL